MVTITNAAIENTRQPQKFSLAEHLTTPWMGLRCDLVLHPGAVDPDGQQTSILEDPLRGVNFKLGYAETKLLKCIADTQTLDEGVVRFYQQTSFRPNYAQIISFVDMLQSNHLTLMPANTLIEQANQQKNGQSFWKRAMHGYVYFRIPLMRPDAFLNRGFPFVQWLWHPWMRILYIVLGMLGIALTLPQIELYVNTASFLFTPQGAIAFGATLVLLKSCHEFAHAFTCANVLSPYSQSRTYGPRIRLMYTSIQHRY